MSTEKSAVLIVGWSDWSVEALTKTLAPLAELFEIEHSDDDLPNILVEEYSNLFTKNMTKEFKNTLKSKEIEITAGAHNDEGGEWYFGFGITAIYEDDPEVIFKLISEISNSLKSTIKGLEIKEPKLYNMISWF